MEKQQVQKSFTFFMTLSAIVLIYSGETEAFEMKTGVKQGYVIALNLFSFFTATIFHLIKNRLPSGVDHL